MYSYATNVQNNYFFMQVSAKKKQNNNNKKRSVIGQFLTQVWSFDLDNSISNKSFEGWLLALSAIPAIKAHAVDSNSAVHSTQGYCYCAGRLGCVWESH